MFPLATGAARKAAVALTAATAGAALLTGTAQAATPTPATVPGTVAGSVAADQPVGDLARLDPRRRAFRVHFRTYAKCVFFANHDRSPRTNGWDCRRGGDRNFPWEYWY
jgi:hypothetical protein